ncbi:MAG: zinc ribbon domain-containing protein [Actinomycetota bacterium]|nr:zinc ribbon domain-containing protein [Actinomycetota bacterium]
MPIYEYACVECGQAFELLQPSGTSTGACPACGSQEVRRRISLVAGLVSGGPSPRSSGGGCGCGGACAC